MYENYTKQNPNKDWYAYLKAEGLICVMFNGQKIMSFDPDEAKSGKIRIGSCKDMLEAIQLCYNVWGFGEVPVREY